jgi:hypothetical protein
MTRNYWELVDGAQAGDVSMTSENSNVELPTVTVTVGKFSTSISSVTTTAVWMHLPSGKIKPLTYKEEPYSIKYLSEDLRTIECYTVWPIENSFIIRFTSIQTMHGHLADYLLVYVIPNPNENLIKITGLQDVGELITRGTIDEKKSGITIKELIEKGQLRILKPARKPKTSKRSIIW